MDYNPDINGIGLRFIGMPNDIKKFYWILAQEGCHPKVAERILNRIKQNGFDLLTVMNRLNFNWIKEQLEIIEVKMEFIPPLENWENKYNDGEWPEEALPEKIKRK